MDKGKNRSDLLAAGRKKLQQYRKKKDHKGSSSNSGNSKGKNSDKLADHDATVSTVTSDKPNANLASDNEIKEKLDDDSGEVLVNLTADMQSSESDLGTENQIADTEKVSSNLDVVESSENETLEDKRDREDASVDQEIAQAASENQMHGISVTEPNSNSEQPDLQTDPDVNPDPKPELIEPDPPQLTPNKEINSGENESLPQYGIESLESIKEELYLTAISKDSIQLQLEEQTGLSADMSKLVKETDTELIQCRSELQETIIAKKGLENAIIAKDSIQVQLDDQTGLNKELSIVVKETEAQLTQCKSELQETIIAKGSIQVQLDEQTGLNKELSIVVKETEAQLTQCKSELQETIIAKDSIQLQLDEQTGLNRELSIVVKETEAQLMQCKSELQETIIAKENEKEKFERALCELRSEPEGQERENVYIKEEREKLEREREILSSENTKLCTELSDQVETLVRLESNIRETSAWLDRLIEENVFLSTSLDLHKLILIESEEKSNQISPNLRFLNVHMEEAKGILGDFKNSIEKIRSGNSGSFNKRGGISNLIKAFESKSNSSDEVPVMEREIPEYSLESTLQLAQKLELALSRLELDLIRENEGAETEREEERCKEEYNNAIQEKIEGLAIIFNNYGDRIEKLQDRFSSTQREADDEAARLLSQLEKLQREADGRVRKLLEERDKTAGVVSEAIAKFNSCTGLSVPDELASGGGADVSPSLFTLVDFATQSIESFRIENKTLCEKNEISIGFASEMRNMLQKLFNNDSEDEKNFDDRGEDLKLIFNSYEGLIANVQKLLEEHEGLLAKNKDLELGLLRKSKEAEEFSIKCESLAENLNDFCLIKGHLESTLMTKNLILEELYSKCVALAKKLPESSEISEITTGDMESDLLNSILPQLDASISLLWEREKEEGLEIDLAKKCLYEANILSGISPDMWALPLPTLLNNDFLPHFGEMGENMDVLSASNIQLETEIEVLRDSLREMDTSVRKSQSELKDKMIELEQSEQRFSSVKEKLGIAVTKGKGLIVQRDGLKQSLLEMSSELERCKEKLKSSTVERIEALESELSYIRNSANVMRDSFLIRDSVIQRIEEVLEDFEFPEEFYAREIVEKIEFVAHMAVRRNSREITEEENSGEMQVVFRQSSDAEAGGLGFETDELKNRYNSLERKYYELAEQNNMLEQSLHEINGLIQKWEEFAGRISIIPPQISEPAERIEWLVSALHDAQTERDALLSKIESLEESSEMLIVDLEGSRKRISELNAEIAGVRSEKDFFSDSLDKLRFDYEVEREAVRKQLAGLRDTISEKIEVENEIFRLVDFVRNALKDECVSEELSRGSSVQCFDKIVRKLLEERNSLAQSDNNSRSIDFDETNSLRSELDEALEKNKSLVFNIDSLNEKYQELVKEREDLQEQKVALNARINLSSEERAHTSEKYHQLVTELEKQRDELQNEVQQLKENQLLEVEALNERIKVLEEEREKHLQLVSELEGVVKQRDGLQEQLNQVREKLNVAVRKGKSLVQHRDGLKQQIETLENEKSSLLNQLEESSWSVNRIQTFLNSFDLSPDASVSLTDPIKKLEIIAKLNKDLKLKATGAETEANKSRRATELLLVELNESQERADLLQEELERIARKQTEEMRQLNLATGKLINTSFEILESLGVKLNKDAGLISYCEAFVGSLANNKMDGPDASSGFASFMSTIVQEISSRKRNHAEYNASERRMDGWNENIFSYVCNSVQELGNLKTSIEKEASLMDQKCENLVNKMGNAQKQVGSLISDLREEIREKEKENSLIIEEKTKEFKSSVVQLQRELQEKELQVSRMSAELSSQIREGEVKINGLERRVGEVEMEKQSLQLRLSELQEAEVSVHELRERVNYYTEMLTKKEQEVESLMQALDEEEKEMEELETKTKQLEIQVEEEGFALKSLEASRSKTLTKLSTTITKFDELHNLSESLLSEIESLQSQLDSRDSEISFLRQEVTRSTNELLSSEESNKKYVTQLNHFSKWVETLILRFGLSFEETEEFEFGRMSKYMEVLDKRFGSVVAEMDELRVNLQSKDSLLQTERGKIVNLTRKCEVLESSLSERSAGTSASSSSVLEIEQSREKVMNVRGGARKGNNNNNNGDQVAIAIEMDDDSHNRLLDEDDDKAHGFKALTKSRFVPRFTRPISDRFDGIWVSGDRLLMRHPTLRLGVLIYWIALHAMLASFI